MSRQGRILTGDWDLYDTRHCVVSHPTMTPSEIEAGYRRARRAFYSWRGIGRAALARETADERLRHLAYSAASKKAGTVWDALIGSGLLPCARPTLEAVLEGVARRRRLPGVSRTAPDGVT